MKYSAVHLCCGSGGGGLGFKNAGVECQAAIDVDELACADYRYLTGSSATNADLGRLEPGDLRRICGSETPDMLFTSAPCKGFSGCLPESRAVTDRYARLNDLAFRSVWLGMEAWSRPPPLVLFENVPRITSARGRVFLDKIVSMLRNYGYAVAETVHDCGELGGLAQRRRRFLLVARHIKQCPPFLRVPATKRVRGVGEVLGALPVPLPGADLAIDGTAGGPMHALSRLSAKNWVRLALIPAGGDWRDIPDGVRLPPRDARQNGPFGVEPWDSPAHAVLAHTTARDTWGSVADPRVGCRRNDGGHGVRGWDQHSHSIIAHASIDNFSCQVADPRLNDLKSRHAGTLGVTDWEEAAHTVTAQHGRKNWDSVADPRLGCEPRNGALGVVGWAQPSHTVIGHASHDNSASSVADPRVPTIVGPPLDIDSRKPVHLVIRAADGCWHRPMTTLELALLQGLPAKLDGEWLKLAGDKHRGRRLKDGGYETGWRDRVGNMVPVQTAEAIAHSCIATLNQRGQGFTLSNEAIWVGERRPHQ